MTLGQPVRISLTTLLASIEQVRGEAHIVFADGGRYIPPSVRGRYDRQVAEELERLGLRRGHRLDEGFEETLQTLGRPATEYFAHLRFGDEHYGILVAVLGDMAVRATRQGDLVLLEPAPHRDHSTMLVERLPRFAAASFAPFSLPHHEFAHDGASAHDLYDDGGRSRAARELDALLKQNYHGLGYLHAACRANGVRTEAEQAISYVDVDAGRVGIELTGPRRNAHVSVFPGEGGRLAARLSGLRASLN